jgi:hypothetical protein
VPSSPYTPLPSQDKAFVVSRRFLQGYFRQNAVAMMA